MDYKEITITPDSEYIQNYPDAIRVIELTDRKAHRYADLALHLDDMKFTEKCLKEISLTENSDIQQALWRCAVIHYAKCFGSGSRSKIDYKKTLKGESQLAFEAHKYFIFLRDKHIAHDVNAFSLCKPGAIINKKGVDPHIVQVIGLTYQANFLDSSNYSNLKNLTDRAIKWIEMERLNLNSEIIIELKKLSHEELTSMKQLTLKMRSTDYLATDKSTL